METKSVNDYQKEQKKAMDPLTPSDLAPLFPPDLRILALGEAARGAREFTLMRLNVLRALLAQQRRVLLVLDAPYAESVPLNEYIQGRQTGKPELLLSNLYYWNYNTEEMLDILNWMREYNANAPLTRRVQIAGCDIQTYHTAIERILHTVEARLPQLARELHALYSPFYKLRPEMRTSYKHQTHELKQRCRSNCEQASALLQRHQDALIARSSPETFTQLALDARAVLAAEALLAAPESAEAHRARTHGMVTILSHLLASAPPETTLLLCGHNHLIKKQGTGPGAVLHEMYGSAFVAVGQCFYQGSIQALNESGQLCQQVLPPALPGSYEALFAETAQEALQAARTLTEARPLRHIGASYSPERPETYYSMLAPASLFDYLLFVRNITPVRLLPLHVTFTRPSTAPVLPDKPTNLDFAHGFTDWALTGSHPHRYAIELEPDHVALLRAKEPCKDGFGALAQKIQAPPGQQIRLTAEVQAEAVEQYCSLWVRVDGEEQMLGLYYQNKGVLNGTQPYQRCCVEASVPYEARELLFGVLLAGSGAVRIKHLSIDIPCNEQT